ncbi:MAG: toll/interleukin-1 receptor domain-containing protein [Bacteroidaceae bacterium]|nr:toll/interleukin-1 receptor domain-containing protein [Bacteroidaceae bacterium]
MKTVKDEILEFFSSKLNRDETARSYEKDISRFAYSHSSDEGIQAFTELMGEGQEYAYEAFFSLATIHRHDRDFSKLWTLISEAEKRDDLSRHASFSHIKIMYETHSESLYDYDLLLNTAHQSACDLFQNSGYHHTFANAFATICEKCLPEDLQTIVDTWYDSALYCVNKAISLEPDYAKYYCTKARIVSIKHHYEESSELILKAIDMEDSRKADYALLIGNYQYYRILIAMRKQQWFVDRRLGNLQPAASKGKEKEAPSSYQSLRPYVFISYSHSDALSVYGILQEMSKAGLNYWYDKELETGSDWTEELGEKILNSEMVMVMLSNNAVLSRNVRNEITMALNHKKKILPVFLEEVELSPGAELQLQGFQWLLKYQMSVEMFRQKLCETLVAVRVQSSDAEGHARHIPQVESPSYESDEAYSPTFGITEQFCASKTGVPEDCEDVIVVCDNYIAVIDGATSKTGTRFEGKTGGKIAAELIASFLQTGVIDSNMDYKTATCRIQAELQAYAHRHQLEQQGIHLCASAVIYSISKRQIWAVGDCQFLLGKKHYTFYKKVDTILSEARSLAIHMLLQGGHTEEELMKVDLARQMILDELKLQQHLENRDDEYGYSVFSSQGSVKNVVVTDVPPGSEVVLASDGYPELFGTLAESEARLNELIRLDPLCYKIYKSTKGLMDSATHFDDRSYIRFRVE